MRNALVAALAAAAAVAFAAPRAARACGSGGGGNYGALAAIAVAGLAVATVDTGLLLWDGGSLIAGHQNSRGYAVFELVWTAPQLAIGGIATASYLNRSYYNRSDAIAPAVFTAAMAMTTAHAIWSLATPEPPHDAEAKAHVTGVGPTWVPLGQKAQPGLGLTGRF